MSSPARPAAAERFAPTRVDESPCFEIDLDAEKFRTIVWATGYRPDYSWLDIPVLDRKGMIKHDGGVIDAAGLYLLGSTFLRRRKSSFIHGAEDDARELSHELVNYLKAKT